MLNMYIREYEWAQSKPRHIDDATLVDLLAICDYQAKRLTLLENIGIEDHADPSDALFMYVLDALGVPDDGHEKIFASGDINNPDTRTLRFSREWFEELFYGKYLLENDQFKYSYQDMIQLIRREIAEDVAKHVAGDQHVERCRARQQMHGAAIDQHMFQRDVVVIFMHLDDSFTPQAHRRQHIHAVADINNTSAHYGTSLPRLPPTPYGLLRK